MKQEINSVHIKRNKIKMGRDNLIFNIIIYVITGLMILVTAYPMYFIIIASISNPEYVTAGEVILYPKGLTLKAYDKLFHLRNIWIGYRNTIIYVIGYTACVLVTNIPVAYVLSRKKFFGKGLLTAFFLIPMFFTGGLIPTYITVKNLHLTNNMMVMMFPFCVIPYYIIVGRTFFNTSIPDDLWEASQLDGCGYIQYFFKVVLPLSKAVISVIALWAAVAQWNGYFNALIYLQDKELQPLQIVLRGILVSSEVLALTEMGAASVEARLFADLIKYASIVVSSLPIMCMYPFVQKYFNQGVMLGSVKG